ncbi:MAG: transposase [bacterium]|nr:transposase [bacterium]
MPQKAYRYRFYPTPDQAVNLNRTFGCVRYIYNRSLRHRQDAWYQRQESVSYLQNSALLTAWKKEPERLWLNEVSSVPLQQTLRHLQAAYRHFFQGRAKYPTFKKKDGHQSAEYTASAFKWDGASLKLAKQAEPLAIRWSRPFKGHPTTVTVSRDPSGRYFVALLIDETVALLPVVNAVVGIDAGIKDVVVTSEGVASGNPRHTAKHAARLAKYQRRLARKQKGSNNRRKAKRKVARVHVKIAECRKDFTHKLTTALIRENQVICVENLAVKNMVKNPTLAKAIGDANWGELVRQLAYKAAWYGRTVVAIDRWFPSSKRCSSCGYTLPKLDLATRQWTCPECKTTHDRDVNAAHNIKAAGLAVLACGEIVNPVSAKAAIG